jgi:uncharacterized membrane protein
MNKNRVEAFSDGVLAVAITLLVLDLKVDREGPDGHSLAYQLAHTWPSYVAYATSFFLIGTIWVNHHAMFNLISTVDRVLLYENLALLMFVTTLPFTTATLADFISHGGPDARWAVALYGFSNFGMAIGFRVMLARMVNHGLLIHPVEPEVGQAAIRRFGLGSTAYPIATAIGLIWPPFVLVGMGAICLYYVVEQTAILPSEAEPEAATA